MMIGVLEYEDMMAILLCLKYSGILVPGGRVLFGQQG
jgi:hypothetical protein